MAFDSSVISFTTKTNKVDLVDASHINAAQSEIVTIETILGTGVKGTAASLSDRLNQALDADGNILSGTSFPSPGKTSQLFYRTDLGVLFIFDVAWQNIASSLSNVIFTATGTTNAQRLYTGSSLSATTGATYQYWFVQSSTYETFLSSKWVKISGVNILTVMGNIWCDNSSGGATSTLKVDVGGLNGTVDSLNVSTPANWKEFTIDVSSLTNGNTYDITIQMKADGSVAVRAYLGAIVILGS